MPHVKANTYTQKFKDMVIAYAKINGARAASRHFNISYYSAKAWSDPVFHRHHIDSMLERKESPKKPKLKNPKASKVKKTKQPKVYKTINPHPIIFKDDLDYSYTLQECKKEYERIKGYNGALTQSLFNKIILTHQPHFYEKEKLLWKDNHNNLREQLLQNREKYLFKTREYITEKELLRGFKISGLHIGFSHFSPLWFKYFIEKYNIKSVYDPCGGWGHRLLGGHSLDRYIYNDLDKRTVDGCKEFSDLLGIGNVIFYNEDARYFTPIDDYEAIFTCPPYHNTEVYQNKLFKDIEDYRKFWTDIIHISKKDGVRYFGYVINNEFKDITKKCFIGTDYILDNEYPILPKNNHFQRVSKNNVKGESIIVYKR